LPDLGRARLFEEALLLVERSAERRPLILVLEDLHWADQATRDLLVFLLRNVMRPGVLFVATSREPLRLPRAEGIRVPPLGRAEVARMLGGAEVARMLGGVEVARMLGGVEVARMLGGADPKLQHSYDPGRLDVKQVELDQIMARSEGNP